MPFGITVTRRDGSSISVTGDDAEWVERKWLELSQLTTEDDADGSTAEEERREARREMSPLPVFLRELAPRGNKEMAAAIVYWAREHDGRPALSGAELRELWRRTPNRAPGNLPRDLARAVAEGLLDQPGRGQYAITGYGARTIGAEK